MHAHDQQTVARTLTAACAHVGLAETLTLAHALADQCNCPGDAVGHDGLESAASQIAGMDLRQISDLIRVGTAHFHLLNKAENILQSDPTRTAEVDYYLQQVRRIVQRTRQSQTWSALYQRRLTIYLAAWIALSVVVLAGRYVLQAELLAYLEDFFWTSTDAIWVQFAPMTVGAIAAGSLGAATSVLLNMQRHAAQEYGYFDRKYGLRGLLLPLLGALFGLVLAVLWAAICYFVGLDGTNVWIASLPAIAAFLLGFAQEWLYGAR